MISKLFSVTSIVATLAILLFARLVFQTLQRCLWHPLRAVPGPWANSVSELPAALALITGNQHLYYRSLHDKYGPVVRVSPNELSFVRPEAREEIYGLRKGGLNMEKSPIFLGAVGGVDGQTGFENLMRIQVEKFIAVLGQMADEKRPADLSSWYTYLAFDVMGDLCFAEPFGCLEQASATEWSTSVINVFVAATWTQGIRRLSGVGTWLESIMLKLFVPPKAAEWAKTHLRNSREKTLRRLADPDRDHTDFMYHILINNESKKSLSQTEIILNMALFISAGTDTTATALTGWTYFVCTHPEVYSRLMNEIRGALATEEDVKWEKVKDLRYLETTIHEALRLFPPSPASQQRIVPRGGATIDGYYVPAGMTVAVPPWVSTHSPLNFHNPYEFRPERWLGEENEFEHDRLNASLPFGTGPRVCIGRNLAYMEMRLISANLLFHFDLELDRGEFEAKNDVWGLDGRLKSMKIFHSMTKPELWVRLRKVRA
ncbi:hypothetical protein LA080_009883 [Diaporthe eres]|nr:hypothetical protein LA080_009883 [Diaporthe eres]